MIKIEFEKIHPNAVLPAKAHGSDAGFDLTAVSFEKKDFTVVAHTGLRMKLPLGYEAQIRSRSGLGSKGIVIANGPGTIDCSYRGELLVLLGSITGHCPWMTGDYNKSVQIGNHTLNQGDRVAQLVIQKVLDVEAVEGEVSTDTERGEGGLGSTGA